MSFVKYRLKTQAWIILFQSESNEKNHIEMRGSTNLVSVHSILFVQDPMPEVQGPYLVGQIAPWKLSKTRPVGKYNKNLSLMVRSQESRQI